MKKSGHSLGLLILFLIMLQAACTNQADIQILSQAEKIIDSKADSAFSLLNNIRHPEKKNRDFYMNYLLLYTRAKDKNDLDISEDTLILKTIPYFFKQEDENKIAYASFYAGRLTAERGEDQKAIQFFFDAVFYANKNHNYELLGLAYYHLGELYQNQLFFENAIDAFTLSKDFFNKSGNTKNEHYSYLSIACCNTFQGRDTLALKEIREILSFAEKSNDNNLKSDVLKWISYCYLKMNKLENAKNCVLNSLQFNTNLEDLSNKYLLLSNIYRQLNHPDSASYYSNLNNTSILQSESWHLKAKFFRSKSEEYEADKDYKKAFQNYKQYKVYIDSIDTQDKENSILEISAKYQTEKIKNEYNQVIIQRQLLIIILITLFCIAMLLLGFGIHHKNKNNEKLLQIELLSSSYRELTADYNKLNADHEDKAYRIKKLLIEKLNMSKKVGLLNTLKSEEKLTMKKVNEIYYGEEKDFFDWEEFFVLLNDLYDNFMLKLAYNFPSLSNNEIQLCGLLKAGLNSGEVALVSNLLPNTFRMKKSQIRKKLRILDGGDIICFLDDFLEKNA